MKVASVIAETPKGFKSLFVGSPSDAAAEYRKLFKSGAPSAAVKVALISNHGLLKQFKANRPSAKKSSAKKSSAKKSSAKKSSAKKSTKEK